MLQILIRLVFTLFILFLYLPGIPAQEDKLQDQKRYQLPEDLMVLKEHAPVTGPRAWALGCSAVLFERNHYRHDLLAGMVINQRNIDEQKKHLKEWWDITTREELITTLQQLIQERNQTRFKVWYWIIKSTTPEQRLPLIDQYQNQPDIQYKMQVIQKHLELLDDRCIPTWSYCRFIQLCRWGYLLNLISESEAWSCIMYAARKLQESFDSWEKMGRNYLIAREFWNEKQTQETGHLMNDALIRLLDIPDSPWNRYPWDLKLGDTPPPPWLFHQESQTNSTNKNPSETSK